MKNYLAVGLACLMTFSITSALSGAETTPPAAGKAAPSQLEGKIVALDKNARLMTVDIKGTLIKIRLTVNVKLTKNGKSAVFENLAPGQTILVSFVEMPNGRIEVAALNVQGGTEATEPAGAKPSTPQPTRTPVLGNTPYGLPNPANVNGNANSSYK